MGTVSYYLDARRLKKNGKAPLKIAVSYGANKRFFIPAHVDLAPAQWCGRVTRRSDKYELQQILDEYLNKVEIEVLKLTWNREIYNLPQKIIRSKLEQAMQTTSNRPTIVELFDLFIEVKSKKNTQLVYINTKNKLREFCGVECLITEVDKTFLKRFDNFLISEGLRPNTRAIHIRNFRTVYNVAIDLKYVSEKDNPFKIFTIENESVVVESRVQPSRTIRYQRSLMTKKLRDKVKSRDNYTCQECGVSLSDEPHLLLEVDHIIPLSKGGKTTMKNLQTLCWRCNRTKGGRLL